MAGSSIALSVLFRILVISRHVENAQRIKLAKQALSTSSDLLAHGRYLLIRYWRATLAVIFLCSILLCTIFVTAFDTDYGCTSYGGQMHRF